MSDDFDNGRVITPRTGPAGDTFDPSADVPVFRAIVGDTHDDDALAFEQYFEETSDGMADDVDDKEPRHAPIVKRTAMLISKVGMTSTLQASQLFPEQPTRISLMVTTDGPGVRIAESPGDCALGAPLPRLTSVDGTAVVFYGWTGPVFVDGPAVSGTVTVTGYATVEL